MNKQKRRLIPIVDRGFQYKYTALIMGVAGVISVALGWFLLDAYTEMNSMIEISSEIQGRLDAEDTKRVFYLVVGFLGAEVVILGVLGLLITHRVVGPVFVLHRHLVTLLDGKYPALRPLRAGDEFRSTFEAFSETVALLKERDQSDLAALEQVQMAAEEKGLSADQIDVLKRMIDERRARTAA